MDESRLQTPFTAACHPQNQQVYRKTLFNYQTTHGPLTILCPRHRLVKKLDTLAERTIDIDVHCSIEFVCGQSLYSDICGVRKLIYYPEIIYIYAINYNNLYMGMNILQYAN